MAAILLLGLACVFGAVIGTRHSVAALIVALPLAITAVGWLAIHTATGMSIALLWQFLTVSGLQIGYLTGGFLSIWDARQLARG